MSDAETAHWIYNQTVRMFATPGDPPFEDTAELERYWGRVWGLNNDVGRMRSVLVHRPGPEMSVVDPKKRIESIGSYGDLEAGWYFQHDSLPDVPAMQSQHDALVAALTARGVEVHYVDGVDNGRLKSCYTRDPLIMVNGGAIICRMGTRVRRGEELAITRTLARLGIPILRTLSGTAVMEGGSFAWINPKTAVIGCGIRVNREGAAQIGEVLARQGVELIVIDLVGYDIHIDGYFLMIDRDLALINTQGLPFSFLERLDQLGVRTIEVSPADNPWIVNSLTVAPGEMLMPEGATNRTLDQLAAAGVKWEVIPFDKMHPNGGGIHCSTTPLSRDPI
ncbi:MAG: amidinotransferase [Cereibacter sphaeroides]|uniref:arginine deiminase n=1 Tax=Cereibacter sphaeroides TaxID=1063 RepID=A0A2W5S7P6_CERSP|nr:MAG: amidinotransferase [Cereibacter sphaeroides]